LGRLEELPESLQEASDPIHCAALPMRFWAWAGPEQFCEFWRFRGVAFQKLA